MKFNMKYNEGVMSIDKNVFSHVSHFADGVESCAGFNFRTRTSPDSFISIRISRDAIQETTLQIILQKNSNMF